MHPFILIGVAAGAFFLGRRSATEKPKKVTGTARQIPVPTPLPLPPAIDEVLDDVEIPDLPGLTKARDEETRIVNGAAWAKTGFDVQVYPKGADRFAILPPPKESGMSASRDCSIVAVGARWWDRAGTIAQQLHDDNLLTVANIERALLPPQCRGLGAGGDGMYALRAELLERVQSEFGPIRNPRRRRRRWWS